MYNLQCASEAAAAGRPLTGTGISALVRGGLGSFRLAHAEAAAHEACLSGATASSSDLAGATWRCGAGTLASVSRGVSPAVARALARHGLVTPLLQVIAHDHALVPRLQSVPHSSSGCAVAVPAPVPAACMHSSRAEAGCCPSAQNADVLAGIDVGIAWTRLLWYLSAEWSLPQALPWRATALEPAANVAAWWTILLTGTRAVGELLAAILAADAPARAAVLQDGSWDAAAQRVRWASAAGRPALCISCPLAACYMQQSECDSVQWLLHRWHQELQVSC